MGNPWMEHVKKTRALHPEKSFKEVLVLAGKTYKKIASTVKSGVGMKGGNKCNMTGDGSGSVTQADAVQCGIAPNACGPSPVSQEGGKRKKRKARKSRKPRKSRKGRKSRKSRKSRKGRKGRKSRKGRK